jgi:HEAT repeat protein
MRALVVFLGISLVVCNGCEQRRAPRTPVQQPNRQPWSDRDPEAPTAAEQRKLQSPDPEVRKSAARELWQMGTKAKEAIPGLCEALKDEDPEVRGFAARALAKMGPEAQEAVPTLTEMLRDHGTYADSAIITLVHPGGGVSEEQPIVVGERTMYVRANAAEALGRVGATAGTALPALQDSLEDEEAEVRRTAAEALGNMGPTAKAAVPSLIKVLCDKKPDVRGPAARALGRIGNDAEPAIRALAELLHDKTKYLEGRRTVWFGGEPVEGRDPKAVYVCDSAAEALGRMETEVTIPVLRDLLGDKDVEVRSAAAKALGNLGPKAKPTLSDLVSALKDKSWEVRHSAAEALGKMGPEAERAIPDLKRLLEDENVQVRRAAAEALSSLWK